MSPQSVSSPPEQADLGTLGPQSLSGGRASVHRPTVADSLSLFWIPLGADTAVVRWSGRLYEAIAAAAQRRQRQALYHAALVAYLNGADVTVEVAVNAGLLATTRMPTWSDR